jgi:hypothetical protein
MRVQNGNEGFLLGLKCIAFGAPGGRGNDVPVIMWIHPARCNHALDRTRAYGATHLSDICRNLINCSKVLALSGERRSRPFDESLFRRSRAGRWDTSPAPWNANEGERTRNSRVTVNPHAPKYRLGSDPAASDPAAQTQASRRRECDQTQVLLNRVSGQHPHMTTGVVN